MACKRNQGRGGGFPLASGRMFHGADLGRRLGFRDRLVNRGWCRCSCRSRDRPRRGCSPSGASSGRVCQPRSRDIRRTAENGTPAARSPHQRCGQFPRNCPTGKSNNERCDDPGSGATGGGCGGGETGGTSGGGVLRHPAPNPATTSTSKPSESIFFIAEEVAGFGCNWPR